MTIRSYYGAAGVLTAPVDSVGTVLTVDTTLALTLAATFVNGLDSTYLMLTSGTYGEVVRVTNVDGNLLSVERGAEGTTPIAHPIGTRTSYVLTAPAVAEAVISSDPTTVAVYGGGIASVSQMAANEYQVEVANPDFVGNNGISVVGSWPAYEIFYTPQENECCPGGSGGSGSGIEYVNSQGIADAYINGDTLNISVAEPQFYSNSSKLTITGSWPYIDFTLALDAAGTVTSVAAGAGLQITGNPAVNPTLSIANTGVTAGTYGGMMVNARGQITQVPLGFNPISAIEAGTGIDAVRTGNTVAISAEAAAVGVQGVIAIADETDDFDPNDNVNAATPAVVAKALESLAMPELNGASSYIGESDGDYTNTISATGTALQLLAGEKALVYGEVTAFFPLQPGNAVGFGLAVFDASPAKIKSNRLMAQSQQSISFIVEGPVNTSLALVTTELPSDAVISSFSFWVQKQ